MYKIATEPQLYFNSLNEIYLSQFSFFHFRGCAVLIHEIFCFRFVKSIFQFFQGIFINEVAQQSPAFGRIQSRDKVLDVDGVDFTKISLADAQTVLSNSGPIINIMISRGN